MTILLFFIETKIGRTIAITGAIIVGVLIGWVAFRTHYYNQGYNAAIAAVAAKNKEATDAVNKAISDVDACNNSGGQWSTIDGVCSK